MSRLGRSKDKLLGIYADFTRVIGEATRISTTAGLSDIERIRIHRESDNILERMEKILDVMHVVEEVPSPDIAE